MASTNHSNRKTVNSCEGLELNLSDAGLQMLPVSPVTPGIGVKRGKSHSRSTQGIEATPGEKFPKPALQTVQIPTNELEYNSTTTSQVRTASSSDLKFPSSSHSSSKSRRSLLFLVAAIVILVLALAIAIPLMLRLRKPPKQYFRHLHTRG